MATDIIETAALGRPFRLGMLYDCRKDALVPAITLWDHGQLQENTVEDNKQHSEFQIRTSDSIEEKSKSLKISGSLQLSLLAGLVNVGGSAKYFQDTKKSLKQERLTLQYKTTTGYKSLTMSHLGRGQVSHPNVFEDDTATHVVTAILYGASAYFVFDRESSKDEEKKHIEGEAKFMENILSNLTGETSFEMDGKVKSVVDKFSCMFHGDFQLPNNPSSFVEAVDVYRRLPTLLGENGEHAVPVRVWLHPLVKLDPKASRLLTEISHRLVRSLSEVIEHLNKTEMRCNDLLKDTAATTFPAIEEKLKNFKQYCCEYYLEFVQKLGSVLPSIRGGGQEESALTSILTEHEKSPFNSNNLDHWLKSREEESRTLKHFLEQLQQLDVNVDENFSGLSVSAVQNMVSFSFTSLDPLDSFLDELSNFLKPVDLRGNSLMSNIVQTISGLLSTVYNKVATYLFGSSGGIPTSEINRQLQLLKELKNLPNSDNTKFIVTSSYNKHYTGACIFIYEHGCDEPVPFIPPSKPANPAILHVSHDTVTVQLSNPDSATVEYRAEFRMKQETKWKVTFVQKSQNCAMLSELEPDTEYEIRATAVGKLGYAVSSDAVTAVTDKVNISPPTNVKVTQVRADSITLTWIDPNHCEDVKQYIIEYKEKDSNEWKKVETKEKVNTFTLKKLKQNTTYTIRMRSHTGVQRSGYENALTKKTTKGPEDDKRFTPLSGNPRVYLLKMESAIAGQLNKQEFGEASPSKPSNKTIMLVGATGSGKTTLINGMINYILGVDWENNWRFKLIDEETNTSQAHSQTSEITAYQIHCTDEFQIPYSLTIIDTPGFGDTRGIKQDKEITDKIRQFFTNKDGIDGIDAVCFVVQAALARLTHTQRYIFEAIMSVFGNNIANNIITLVSFADGKSPPALEAIKEAKIPCATQDDGSLVHFKFNNSVLFANNNSDEGDFDHMFWKMGMASMKKFFTYLNTMETQSLTLTKQVLQERKQLATTVEGVQPLIRKGLSTMEEIRTTQAIVDKHKTQIEENKDFEYEVEVEKSDWRKIPTGQYVTNCHTCNFTCHFPCVYPDDAAKEKCSAMVNGNCTVCPGKCVWSVHHNMTYRWDITRVKEKRTYQNLKSKFEAALGEKMNTEKVVEQLQVQYDEVKKQVAEMMTTVSKCLTRLKEIALRPDPLATPDYIDMLIETEKTEAKPGWQQRIKELQEVREQAVIMQNPKQDWDFDGVSPNNDWKKQEAEPGLKSPKGSKGVFSIIRDWFKR